MEIVKKDTKISFVLPDHYTQEQKKFITANKNSNIILRACAGAGKTAVMIDRIRFLISQGVAPDRICMFSFTTNTVNDFKKRLGIDEVKVTTIHAFCLGMLSKMGKFKKVADIYEFIQFYKENNKPGFDASQEIKDDYYALINDLYETAEYISAEIAAYKLQTASGIKCKLPEFYIEYCNFLHQTRSRDFTDMLLECIELLKENKWLNMFKNKYDYMLLDEFQDISVQVIALLLKINPKHIIIAGDIFQSIYGYTGSNAMAVMDLLKKKRKCVEMTLSTNFRSTKAIVEHANKYSDLKAISSKSEDGLVHKDFLTIPELIEIIKTRKEVAILVRTNKIIKSIEKILLENKVPMQYNNYLTAKECDDLKKATARPNTKRKVDALRPFFPTTELLVSFIEKNASMPSKCTSIHKSKGMQYQTCVVVNSVSPEILTHNKITNLTSEQFKAISFDPDLNYDDDPENFESKNIFYTASTRPIYELFYMIRGI